MTPDEQTKCQHAAREIRAHADQLVRWFGIYDQRSRVPKAINKSLQEIDDHMAYLTDVMAKEPPVPIQELPGAPPNPKPNPQASIIALGGRKWS